MLELITNALDSGFGFECLLILAPMATNGGLLATLGEVGLVLFEGLYKDQMGDCHDGEV